MQSVVITGASTGIGEACALRLDRLGWQVFAGVRKVEDGEVLRRKSSTLLTPVRIDITSSESLAAAAKTVEEEIGGIGLHGLVNNAGVAVAGPLEYLPIEDLRRQLDINVVGQIAATQAFLPLLRRAQGRVINIGSISGRVAIPLMGPYCASKFALEALTASLRMELKPWGIHVAMIEPASIATPIWRKSLADAERIASQYPPEAMEQYGTLISAQRKRAAGSDSNGLPPSMVVRDIVHALTSPKPKVRYIIGRTAKLGEIIRFLPDRLRERLILRQLR